MLVLVEANVLKPPCLSRILLKAALNDPEQRKSNAQQDQHKGWRKESKAFQIITIAKPSSHAVFFIFQLEELRSRESQQIPCSSTCGLTYLLATGDCRVPLLSRLVKHLLGRLEAEEVLLSAGHDDVTKVAK